MDQAQMVWSSDIEITLLRVHPKVTDWDYYLSTVDRIEQGLLPTGKGKLTMSALEAWEQSCTEKKGTTDADHTTNKEDPSVILQDPSEGHYKRRNGHLRIYHPRPKDHR